MPVIQTIVFGRMLPPAEVCQQVLSDGREGQIDTRFMTVADKEVALYLHASIARVEGRYYIRAMQGFPWHTVIHTLNGAVTVGRDAVEIRPGNVVQMGQTFLPWTVSKLDMLSAFLRGADTSKARQTYREGPNG